MLGTILMEEGGQSGWASFPPITTQHGEAIAPFSTNSSHVTSVQNMSVSKLQGLHKSFGCRINCHS
jgi:hypothetical protein